MTRAGGVSRSRSFFPDVEKHKALMGLGVLMDHGFLSVSLTSDAISHCHPQVFRILTLALGCVFC